MSDAARSKWNGLRKLVQDELNIVVKLSKEKNGLVKTAGPLLAASKVLVVVVYLLHILLCILPCTCIHTQDRAEYENRPHNSARPLSPHVQVFTVGVGSIGMHNGVEGMHIMRVIVYSTQHIVGDARVYLPHHQHNQTHTTYIRRTTPPSNVPEGMISPQPLVLTTLTCGAHHVALPNKHYAPPTHPAHGMLAVR